MSAPAATGTAFRGALPAAALLGLLVLPGCATYGAEGGGIRTWQAEPVERILRQDPPHERIQLVLDGERIVLEGARLEADSVIGFREVDEQWERVSVPTEAPERVEVKKLNTPLTALTLGATAALAVVGLVVGG